MGTSLLKHLWINHFVSLLAHVHSFEHTRQAADGMAVGGAGNHSSFPRFRASTWDVVLLMIATAPGEVIENAKM